MTRLVIDSRVLQEQINRSRGLGSYCHNLLCGLGEAWQSGTFECAYLQHRGTPWMRPEYPAPVRAFEDLGTVGRRAGLINPLLDYALRPVYRSRWPIDVLHVVEPFAHLPLYMQRHTRLVVTVHDLIPLRMRRQLLRGSTSGRLRALGVRMGLSTLRRADAVIAVSHQTRRDLRRLLHIEERKLHVIHEAVDPATFRQTSGGGDGSRLLARLGVAARRFVLHVGDVGERKDFRSLLRAFASARRELPALRLVMVGSAAVDRRFTATRAFWRHVEELGLAENVVATGFLDASDLVQLYQSALALLFPTRMEGFGLPLLEAMHCGCPVVACRLPVFRELLGPVDWLVPRGDTAAMSGEIVRLARDDVELERRRAHGLARAALFSRATMARRTLEVYRSVVDGERAGPREPRREGR